MTGVGVLRAVFKIGIESGALFRNPAIGIKRANIRPKQLTLPEVQRFDQFQSQLGVPTFNAPCRLRADPYLITVLAFCRKVKSVGGVCWGGVCGLFPLT